MGELLEHHRAQVLRITIREAAARAGISEGRWRQVVNGGSTPVRNLVKMALAVGADPAEVLRLAGEAVSRESLAAMVADGRPAAAAPADDLAAEIERIEHLRLPARARLAMLRALVNLHAEVAAEDERRRTS